jgi:hypothetical protein
VVVEAVVEAVGQAQQDQAVVEAVVGAGAEGRGELSGALLKL